jgi:glucose-specific phosphotransferase system IIA component
MFDFLKKSYRCMAPIDGRVVELSEVPNPVFAEGLAGEGIAIETTGDIVVSPVDGKLTMIFTTNHAFAVTQDNGISILVHIGIDTIALEGEGFERMVEEGQSVKMGEPILKVDREKIQSKGYSLITPVLITNSENVKEIIGNIGGEVSSGEHEVLTYKLK